VAELAAGVLAPPGELTAGEVAPPGDNEDLVSYGVRTHIKSSASNRIWRFVHQQPLIHGVTAM